MAKAIITAKREYEVDPDSPWYGQIRFTGRGSELFFTHSHDTKKAAITRCRELAEYLGFKVEVKRG